MQSIQFHLFFDEQIPTVTHQQKKYSRKTGHTYEPKRLKEARELFMSLTAKEKPEKEFIGPVELQMDFFYSTPDKKKKGHYKTSRPDLDNTCKLIQDCFTANHYWADDNQVVVLKLSKHWSMGEPYIRVSIKELEDK